MMIMGLLSRYWLQITAAAVLAGFAWHYQHLIKSNTKLESALELKQIELEQSQAIIDKERQNAAELALRAQKFYEDKQHDQTELDNLRKCVADKSCGVRVVKGACPVLSGTNSTTGGAEAADAADRKQFEQDYFSLVESIKETKRRYDWMQSELIARSHPDYCKAN